MCRLVVALAILSLAVSVQADQSVRPRPNPPIADEEVDPPQALQGYHGANMCLPMINVPRGEMHRSKIIVLGVAIGEEGFGSARTGIFTIEHAWKGDINAGDVVRYALKPDECSQSRVEIGRKYVVTAPCNAKPGSPDKADVPCTAMAVRAYQLRMLIRFLDQNAPPLDKGEILQRLTEWADGTASASETLEWLATTDFRDTPDWDDRGRSLLDEALLRLEHWLRDASQQASKKGCSLRRDVPAEALAFLAAVDGTSDKSLMELKTLFSSFESRLRIEGPCATSTVSETSQKE